MAGSYIRNAEVERKMALGLYYLCQTKAFRSDPDCEDFQDLYLADFGVCTDSFMQWQPGTTRLPPISGFFEEN